MSYTRSDSRIYVGNLPGDVRSKDIEDLFQKYGKINYIDLKNRKGPPFAFVEFDDPRDAEDAIDGRDGYNFDGYKLRVEFQKGSRGGGRGGDDSDRRSRRGGPPTRRSKYRCLVSGLPSTGSWQDLKDHMREAGNVCYADVYKDGTGVVEFVHYEDMKYAARKLDDTKFRSHEGDSSYIRVKIDPKLERSTSRSRSRSRSRGDRGGRGSPSYSPVKRRGGSTSRSRSRSSRSRSRSRSESPRRDAKRSVTRSRTRSPADNPRAEKRSKTHSKTKSPSRDRAAERSRSRSKSRDKSASRSRSRSRSKSQE